MSQVNHNECWIRASDPPQTQRPVIIWTKKPWVPKGTTLISRHLDTEGAWYDIEEATWYHSDGHIAENVSHWMEMPGSPART